MFYSGDNYLKIKIGPLIQAGDLTKEKTFFTSLDEAMKMFSYKSIATIGGKQFKHMPCTLGGLVCQLCVQCQHVMILNYKICL